MAQWDLHTSVAAARASAVNTGSKNPRLAISAHSAVGMQQQVPSLREELHHSTTPPQARCSCPARGEYIVICVIIVDTGDQLCRGELDLLGKVGELQESIDRPDENVVEERAMGSVEIRMQRRAASTFAVSSAD